MYLQIHNYLLKKYLKEYLVKIVRDGRVIIFGHGNS